MENRGIRRWHWKSPKKAGNKKQITRGSDRCTELGRCLHWDCLTAWQKCNFCSSHLSTLQRHICLNRQNRALQLGWHSGRCWKWEGSVYLSTKLGIIPPSNNTTLQNFLRWSLTYLSSSLGGLCEAISWPHPYEVQISLLPQTFSFL